MPPRQKDNIARLFPYLVKIDKGWEAYANRLDEIIVRTSIRPDDEPHECYHTEREIVSATISVEHKSTFLSGRMLSKKIRLDRIPNSHVDIVESVLDDIKHTLGRADTPASRQILRIIAEEWAGKPKPPKRNGINILFPLFHRFPCFHAWRDPDVLLRDADVSVKVTPISKKPQKNRVQVVLTNVRGSWSLVSWSSPTIEIEAFVEHDYEQIQWAPIDRIFIEDVELDEEEDPLFIPTQAEEQILKCVVWDVLGSYSSPDVETVDGRLVKKAM